MTGPERDKFIRKFFENECRRLLLAKGEEYKTGDQDVNGNFKRVAAEQEQAVLQVWNTMFQKHLDSIRNYVKDPKKKMAEPIEQRIADAVNYLLILASLIEEEHRPSYGGEKDA